MSDTKINYLTKTWNPITGCTHAGSPGCDNCWARELHEMRHRAYLAGKKMPEQYSKPFSEIQFHPERLDEPLRWRKPQRVGVVFGGDWMHPALVPKDWEMNPVDEIHGIMMACGFLDNRKHTFFTLTKRPERLADYYAHKDLTAVWEMCADHNVVLDDPDWLFSEMMSQYSESEKFPLPNVFNGATVCNQEELDRNAPHLLSVPGRHWLSIEPMLGPISFRWAKWQKWRQFHKTETRDVDALKNFDFVVIGCESGPNRRLCKLAWILDVVEQCKAAGVPCFVKQVPIPKPYPKGTSMSGRLTISALDSGIKEFGWRVSHDMNEWPEELRLRELP